MPELPEVEVIAQSLHQYTDQKVKKFFHKKKLNRSDNFEEEESFVNKKITIISRYGKYLFISFDNKEHLLIHLGMTGIILIEKNNPLLSNILNNQKHLVFLIELSNSDLIYMLDPRGFGQIKKLNDLKKKEFLNKLAKDPLDSYWTKDKFANLLQKSSQICKNFLLDQKKISGIGNIYACEALFKSQISPQRPSNKISLKEGCRLFQEIVTVLKMGISQGGASVRDYKTPSGAQGNVQNFLSVYNRHGQPCINQNCNEQIQRLVISGRGTYWCPSCQK